jgi:PAS domain S-box-containing protein
MNQDARTGGGGGHELHEKLAASEEAFRLIVEGVRDYAIFMLDERGHVMTWNAGAERIKGYRADEIIGRHFSTFYTAEDLAGGKPPRELEIASATGRYQEEGVRVRRDGTTFWADVLITALRDRTGRLRGFAKVTRDVTERKEAQRALEAALERAEEANRAKDHFLAVLSHELRTPLTPVLATVSFVEKRADLPEELRLEIGSIRRNVELEARLVDDLLDMTRIARGKVELHYEVLDAHAVVRAAVQVAMKEIEDKGLDLTLSLRARNRHVWGDPTRMQQVMSNLIQNAVKFTPAGGSVTVRTSDEAGEFRAEVRDTGVGIEAGVLPKLFNPFEQGDRTVTRGRGGLGLGLSISRSIVELHKGTLTAASEGRGKGATFTVVLAAMPEVAEQPAAGGAGDAAAAAARGTPEERAGRQASTVLLVEDHDDTRRAMANLLKSFGYNVKTASNVAEGIAMAERERIDLLVSDIGLPDGTGHDVMRHAKGRGIRGIALSGYGQEQDIQRSREAGFETHLVKPVNFQTLESVIRRVEGAGKGA